MKRKVKIERRNGNWTVLYVERQKGQHYSAASFYARDYSRDYAEAWVASHPHLELVS